jgi:hypothetical protein
VNCERESVNKVLVAVCGFAATAPAETHHDRMNPISAAVTTVGRQPRTMLIALLQFAAHRLISGIGFFRAKRACYSSRKRVLQLNSSIAVHSKEELCSAGNLCLRHRQAPLTRIVRYPFS